jgi:hypothetical protein
MHVLCSRDGRNVRDQARYALEPRPAARSKLAGTIRDVTLIAFAWMIFIGVFVYPAAQIVGILACAIALLVGSGRAGASASVEI